MASAKPNTLTNKYNLVACSSRSVFNGLELITVHFPFKKIHGIFTLEVLPPAHLISSFQYTVIKQMFHVDFKFKTH